MKQLALYNERLYELAGINTSDNTAYLTGVDRSEILFVKLDKTTVFTEEVSDIMREFYENG